MLIKNIICFLNDIFAGLLEIRSLRIGPYCSKSISRVWRNRSLTIMWNLSPVACVSFCFRNELETKVSNFVKPVWYGKSSLVRPWWTRVALVNSFPRCKNTVVINWVKVVNDKNNAYKTDALFTGRVQKKNYRRPWYTILWRTSGPPLSPLTPFIVPVAAAVGPGHSNRCVTSWLREIPA